MTLFVGGPYDGRDLPVNPDLVKTVRLPEVDEWDATGDPDATVPRKCPYVYEVDAATTPPQFRFVGNPT